MAVRLELDQGATLALEASLRQSLGLTHEDVYRSEAPLQLSDLTALAERDHRPELRAEPFTPALPPALRDAESLFPVLARGDVLLQHPYESFDLVTRFIEEAADDPNVLAIKQTLYRIAPDSPIARALSRAAENGKQVAALVELKARLDEANNIAWARRMEEAGRARGLRAHRAQDPLQDRPGRPARGPGHPPLRPPRHRQLQRADRAAVHRPVALHRPDRRGRRRERALQHAHRLRRAADVQAAGGGALRAAGEAHRADPARGGPGPSRRGRAHPRAR